jgi:hypothetical protein
MSHLPRPTSSASTSSSSGIGTLPVVASKIPKPGSGIPVGIIPTASSVASSVKSDDNFNVGDKVRKYLSISFLTRLKILPVLTREHYTSLLHWV